MSVQKIRLLHTAAMIVLTCAAGAQAQSPDPVTARKVDISIGGDNCLSFPHKISVVMDDQDGNTYRFPVTGGPPDCQWKGDALETFDASLTHFSLRLVGVARTDCRTVEETYKDTQGNLMRVARLKFECCPQDMKPVQQVTVSMDRPIPVSYLRRVPKSSEKDRVHSVPCTEHAVFEHGAGTIDHVQFQTESLRLQLGEKAPKPESPGLLVRTPKKKDPYDIRLDRSDVVGAFIEQRAQGDAGQPNFSSNAIEIDDKRLREAGVKTLQVTVQ